MPFGFRPDGDLVKDSPLVRRIQPFIMPTRTESQVFFELSVNVAAARPFLDAERARTGLKVTLLHVVVLAIARTLAERPRLNRFVAGYRLWQRRGVWISFSAKTEKTDQGAVVALKRKIDPAGSIEDVVRAMDVVVKDTRAGKKDRTDKELALALAAPVFITKLAVAALRALDRWGVMPRSMIDGDPLYTSMFIANMGSIGMDAPFHHLFEWGNCPLFCAIGKERTDGTAPFRFTFDERVEDGLYCLRALDRLKELIEDPRRLAPPAPDPGAP